MKCKNLPGLLAGLICALGLLVSPLMVVAEDQLPEPPSASPVIITELQTGAGTAGDEFIELYNVTDAPVDITGWQIRFANAGTETTTLLAEVTPVDSQPMALAAHAYFLLHTSGVPATGTAQVFNAGLSKTDKTVALFAADPETCLLQVADAVAWAVPTAGATAGEGTAIDSTAFTTKEKLLRRVRDTAGNYIDSNNNDFDFVMSASTAGAQSPAVSDLATPGIDGQFVLPADAELPAAGQQSPWPTLGINGCTPEPTDPPEDTDPPTPAPEESPPSVVDPPDTGSLPEAQQPAIPAGNIGLKPPLLSELLPNPASPQTDKDDEFIELYNPNDDYFDLGGYVLEVGLTTKKHYTIAQGTSLAPRSFLAFFAADTNLALSNNGSQVVVKDPLGGPLVTSEAYGTAKDGQAWILAGGVWQWTTKPTPNALNVVAAPQVKKASTTKVKTAATKKVSSSSAKTRSLNTSDETQQAAALVAATPAPLHPGVLALVGVSALLYGAYEYRHDVANRLYQFRSHRAARRALRQIPKGR